MPLQGKLRTFAQILAILAFFAPIFVIGQSNSYSQGFERTLRPGTEDPVAFAAVTDWIEMADKEYSFGDPQSSVYDTLIFNVNDYKPDEVPVVTAEVLSKRLYEIPSLIPMDYNRYVQRYIEVYTEERREQVSRMLGLAKVYFPIFEEYLDREQMPIELKYLPIVESALNPHARSRVGATGLWQFMYGTARMYGLRMNTFVDERKDPKKSTVAALKYLKDAHAEFGDWLLAIASYNCGPGNVRKAIARSGGQRTFWAVRRYLPRETRGYVPAFIAATYVFNYANQHNLYPLYPDFDLYQDTLHLNRIDITLKEIAEMTGADLDLLRNLNPELKLERIPYSSEDYVLNVPPRVAEYFAKYPYSIKKEYGKRRDQVPPSVAVAQTTSSKKSYTPPKPSGRLVYHTVRKGEVVGTIAEFYGVSARQIADWNYLRRYRIKTGQKLKIYTKKSPSELKKGRPEAPDVQSNESPAPKTTQAQVEKSQQSRSISSEVYHKIQSGQTLWNISSQYPGASVDGILKLNPGLNPKKLKAGQVIRVK